MKRPQLGLSVRQVVKQETKLSSPQPGLFWFVNNKNFLSLTIIRHLFIHLKHFKQKNRGGTKEK